MIKSDRGETILNDTESGLIADFMCIIASISESIIIPRKGKQNLKKELYKIVDEVCKVVLERKD